MTSMASMFKWLNLNNTMIEIGKYNDLRIVAKNSDGLSLSDGDREILLPYQHVPKNVELGDNIEVFVFGY